MYNLPQMAEDRSPPLLQALERASTQTSLCFHPESV